jgi:hypothetical protein
MKNCKAGTVIAIAMFVPKEYAQKEGASFTLHLFVS